jgi:hypothetical protein
LRADYKMNCWALGQRFERSARRSLSRHGVYIA